MHNDFRADDGRLDRSPERPRSEAQPLADREVPIEKVPAAIHAWLDGEVPESAVQGAELARDVQLWKRIAAETEQLRQQRAPARLQANIMAAIEAQTPAGE